MLSATLFLHAPWCPWCLIALASVRRGGLCGEEAILCYRHRHPHQLPLQVLSCHHQHCCSPCTGPRDCLFVHDCVLRILGFVLNVLPGFEGASIRSSRIFARHSSLSSLAFSSFVWPGKMFAISNGYFTRASRTFFTFVHDRRHFHGFCFHDHRNLLAHF
jgi:hypothetical protein